MNECGLKKNGKSKLQPEKKKIEEILPGIAALIENVSCIDVTSTVSRTCEVHMSDRNTGC